MLQQLLFHIMSERYLPSCGTQHPVGKCFHKLSRVLHGFELPSMCYIYMPTLLMHHAYLC